MAVENSSESRVVGELNKKKNRHPFLGENHLTRFSGLRKGRWMDHDSNPHPFLILKIL
jgi:hypothetical protein